MMMIYYSYKQNTMTKETGQRKRLLLHTFQHAIGEDLIQDLGADSCRRNNNNNNDCPKKRID